MRNSSLENEEFQSKNIGLTRMPKPNIFIEKKNSLPGKDQSSREVPFD